MYGFLLYVIQQEQVLTELYSYIHQDPPPSDVAMTIEAHKYLEACNLLFEKGFLCHEKICRMDSPVLQNISSGFEYFSSWISTLLLEGIHLITRNNYLYSPLPPIPSKTRFPHPWKFFLE